MAKKEEKSVAVIDSEVPDYIKQNTNRGSENVTADDLTIPRLEIVQSLSPARNKKDPNYIEGAEEGMLYNNVSRELYGESVTVIPITFKKEYLLWKDRKQGGGFRGAFETMDEANARTVELANEGEEGIEAVDTAQHLCLLVRGDGRLEEIAISMAKSKMKVSRQWNSMIRMFGGDRFSRKYTVTGVEDTNDAGDMYYNLSIKLAGFPSREQYENAEKVYNQIAAGREVKVNTDEEGISSGDAEY